MARNPQAPFRAWAERARSPRRTQPPRPLPPWYSPDCSCTATTNTVKGFRKSTGVTIEEAVVVDSGSSAGGRPRAPLTDADRTHQFTFNKKELGDYATKRGISPSNAHKELSEMAMKRINQGMADKLDESGLARTDVDHTSYHGMGTSSGKSDAYSRAAVEQRTEASARATSHKPDGKGGVTSRKISRRAAVDHNQMTQAEYYGGEMTDPKMDLPAKQQVVNQQVVAVKKPDLTVQQAAKAVGRTNRRVTPLGAPMDDDLAQLSKTVMDKADDTQAINEALRERGMTREGFRQAVREAVGEFIDGVAK